MDTPASDPRGTGSGEELLESREPIRSKTAGGWSFSLRSPEGVPKRQAYLGTQHPWTDGLRSCYWEASRSCEIPWECCPGRQMEGDGPKPCPALPCSHWLRGPIRRRFRCRKQVGLMLAWPWHRERQAKMVTSKERKAMPAPAATAFPALLTKTHLIPLHPGVLAFLLTSGSWLPRMLRNPYTEEFTVPVPQRGSIPASWLDCFKSPQKCRWRHQEAGHCPWGAHSPGEETFIHPFNKYSLHAYQVLCAGPAARDAGMDR